ncbi:tyrosine-type recombinase/integrase [Wolbachia endosymbiont of Dirofilaria (Dirofilaria) immitis]|uniref:tyrosine-type recombinase/integrase n=1 Tax=Wolbachia endosymbiont of Dirofilaria (Dirofilaria) immitis TaxID=1812115 RepID=UPI00158BF365|nr:tyrosine-type recombinase/integrase [Wolbachia endosymbiont of Dirofilaria (Dirofilaria) immitis]QKX02346.1 tyrosine-type recombinase/integrase [Wolbachia endosymbiont of Dirofilaria (Dirofilaria) immitis]
MESEQLQDKKENLYITYYIDVLVSERSATQNTLESYRSDLLQLEDFLLRGGTTLINASKANIKDYVKSLSMQKKYKGSSISRKISAVKNFYKCLFNDGIIDFNPAPANDDELKSPRVSRPLPKCLSVGEMLLLMNTVRKSVSGSNKEISNKRLCAILDILYSSGMRITELINMKLCEVLHLVNSNDRECFIIIKGKSGKERQILFNEQALKSLKNYLSVRCNLIPGDKESDWLFPGSKPNKPITRQRIGQLIKELAKKCNIDESKISPHVIRHSFATHLLDSGASIVLIQRILGHTNLSTTQIYTHVTNKELKGKLADLHPITQVINS